MSNYCQTAAAHWKPKREAEDKREGGRRRGRGGGGRGGRRGSRRGHEARTRRKRTKEQAQAKNRTVTTPSNQTRRQAGRFCCWLLLKCCSIAAMPASLLACCWTATASFMCFNLPIGLSGTELARARARISFASRFDLVFDLVFSRLRFPGHVYAYITAITCDECIESCGRSTHSVLGDSEGQMGDKWETNGESCRWVGDKREHPEAPRA